MSVGVVVSLEENGIFNNHTIKSLKYYYYPFESLIYNLLKYLKSHIFSKGQAEYATLTLNLTDYIFNPISSLLLSSVILKKNNKKQEGTEW